MQIDRFRSNQAKLDAKPRVKPKQVVDVEMLHITTQDIVGLVKTITSPSLAPTPILNKSTITRTITTVIIIYQYKYIYQYR